MARPERDTTHLRALLDRLARVAASEDWENDLNPAQMAALGYLARANRFSRAPSQVADYLGATRGTVSQTLKALQRKGLATEERSDTDKRRISYQPTPQGHAVLSRPRLSDKALAGLDAAELTALETSITTALHTILRERGGQTFGQCRTCRYHQVNGKHLRCALLNVDLYPEEANQLCHEHAPA